MHHPEAPQPLHSWDVLRDRNILGTGGGRKANTAPSLPGSIIAQEAVLGSAWGRSFGKASEASAASSILLPDLNMGQECFPCYFFCFLKFPLGYFYQKVKKGETSLPIVFF